MAVQVDIACSRDLFTIERNSRGERALVIHNQSGAPSAPACAPFVVVGGNHYMRLIRGVSCQM